MTTPSRPAGGWTLIELLLVMAIIGTISALGIPALQRAIHQARVARAIGDIEVDAVRADPERFDLVISDLTMSELTGDQVGAALSALRSDLRLILMTGQADHVTPEQVQTWGFHGQMSKPLGARTVAEAVQRVLRSTPSTSNA